MFAKIPFVCLVELWKAVSRGAMRNEAVSPLFDEFEFDGPLTAILLRVVQNSTNLCRKLKLQVVIVFNKNEVLQVRHLVRIM